jgi:hypothetical protein
LTGFVVENLFNHMGRNAQASHTGGGRAANIVHPPVISAYCPLDTTFRSAKA